MGALRPLQAASKAVRRNESIFSASWRAAHRVSLSLRRNASSRSKSWCFASSKANCLSQILDVCPNEGKSSRSSKPLTQVILIGLPTTAGAGAGAGAGASAGLLGVRRRDD
jgi:hypothetical protein